MFFLRLNAEIDWPEKRPLYVTHAKYAHAAVMQAITAEDKSLGKQLHDMQRRKPISLAFVDNCLQISLVGADALRCMKALMAYWQSNPFIELGSQEYAIKNFYLGDGERGQIQSWHDLIGYPSHKHLRFSFLTPAALTRQDSHRKRYTIPFPEPTHFFISLAEQWRSLEGPPLSDGLDDYLHDGGCVMKSHKLHTVAFPIEERTQIGFVGNVTYLCRQSDEVNVQSLNWLTRLAPYVGIGYQTARGMGAVSTNTSR